MGAYIVRCQEIVKNEDGTIKEIHCTADLESGCGNPVDGRKVKGTIHWLACDHCKEITVMHYDKLFTIANTGDIPEDKTYGDYLNPNSMEKIECAKAELVLGDTDDSHYQFVRCGYYVRDSKNPGTYNRVVSLKDSYRPEA